jgi:hypothetical protein
MYNQILTYSCAGSGGPIDAQIYTADLISIYASTHRGYRVQLRRKESTVGRVQQQSQVGRKLRVVAHGVRPSCEDRNPIKTFFFKFF